MSKNRAVRGRTDEEAKAFLDDLCKIIVKHRMTLWSCGCCGSPWLMNLTGDDIVNGGHVDVDKDGDNLQFVPQGEQGHLDHGTLDKSDYMQSDHHSPEESA